MVLQLNGANDVAASADGPFSFVPLPSGSAYSVTIKTQPSSPAQTCTVANASGSVTTAAVTNIAVSCRTLVGKFLYVPNTVSNSVSAYSIDAATGALTAVAGAPYPSGGSPTSLTPDPTGRFVYTTNLGSGPFVPVQTAPSISGYAVNAITGALVAVPGSPFFVTGTGSPPGSAQSVLTFEPSGKFGYTTARISGVVSIYGVAIDASGALSSVPSSPFALTSNSSAIAQGTFDVSTTHYYVPSRTPAGRLSVFDFAPGTGVLSPNSVPSVATDGDEPFIASAHPSGRHLYVPNYVSGNVSVFALDANTGAPGAIAGSPFATGGNSVLYAAVHPSGRFVFAANANLIGTLAPLTVAAFSVDQATGALTAVAGSPFATPGQGAGAANAPALILIDVRGRFLYVNHHSNSIAAFSIDQTTGVLTSVPGSPFATEARPSPPVLDPSGRYLYVVNRDSNTISSYSIHPSTGALALITTLPTGAAPQFVRVVGLQ